MRIDSSSLVAVFDLVSSKWEILRTFDQSMSRFSLYTIAKRLLFFTIVLETRIFGCMTWCSFPSGHEISSYLSQYRLSVLQRSSSYTHSQTWWQSSECFPWGQQTRSRGKHPQIPFSQTFSIWSLLLRSLQRFLLARWDKPRNTVKSISALTLCAAVSSFPVDEALLETATPRPSLEHEDQLSYHQLKT